MTATNQEDLLDSRYKNSCLYEFLQSAEDKNLNAQTETRYWQHIDS